MTKFLIEVLLFHEVHLSQMNPFGLAKVCHFELSCRGLGSDPDLDVFRAFYKLNRSGSWYTFEVRNKNACCYTWITTSLKDWKDCCFLVNDRCVPTEMTWRLKRSRLPPPLPEDFEFNRLICDFDQGGYAHTKVSGTHFFMGLKEALRLKSFDSTELDIRATKTPKGDPPYLNVVQENLYHIRELTAPVNQGGSAGQGGSGLAPSIRTSNVVPAQTTVVAGDKGKRFGSVSAKESGSKFVIYGSEHLSIEDEGVRAEEEEEEGGGDGDGAEVQPQVDQVTGFSTAGGLLENLDAHLDSGRTPRDRPVNIPTSPLSFGGPTTKVIEDIHMPEPQSFKKIKPSPSGKPTTGVASNVSRPSPQPFDGWDSASSSPLWYETEAVFLCRELGSGDALDMDSARALERYVPKWSLANKDRIVDALSTKMALFHLGTPAEHAHYMKMSGPELGNALMLNQAQSNSLVVEIYKRWIESESNCRKFEREIANLKSEDNVWSKTKQELSSLRSQVDRLKEQVSEAKEISKSSQASVAAAYEARDNALQDLETFKLKFSDLEKKLSNTEKRNKVELKEMQTSYDQLLADHHRLINGTFVVYSLRFSVFLLIKYNLSSDKDELEKARDRAIESHKATIKEAKGMLTRCDGEMVELYAQVSELMLTKQWFLTDGVAWVVKLVHQSPELEKVVADLINSVNVVGVNEGIKQGFKAALDSVRSAEEVPGYDEGAKDALDVVVKAFGNFHISVLGKVADLVDKPLSVIKQRSELPIVKEDSTIFISPSLIVQYFAFLWLVPNNLTSCLYFDESCFTSFIFFS
ncbi:hypothetical protein Hanom_Chr03g00278591 [Helianthus anomalus]